MVKIFEHYVSVVENGCDHNCKRCELWHERRNECIKNSMVKWSGWAKQRHEEFGETLRSGNEIHIQNESFGRS